MDDAGAWEPRAGFGFDAAAQPDPEALLARLQQVPPYPPTPVADLVARSRRRARRLGRTRTVAGCAAVLVVVGALGAVAAIAAHRSSAAPQVVPAAWRGHGELAFISGGQLYLLADDATLVTVLGAGTASRPQWSADGGWVAYLRTSSPPADEPYDLEPATLWVTDAAGTRTHTLTAATSDVTEFAWAPSGETLAFEAVASSGPASSSEFTVNLVNLATPAGTNPAPLVTAAYIGYFAWAPSGQSLALDAVHGYPGGQYRPADQLEIVPVDGSPAQVVYRSATATAVVATWWPQGGGLLFWLDPQGSGSAAADGLTLESLDLASGAARPLATTLPYRNWLAWSPDGSTVALVAGTDRVVWDSGRRVEWCPIATGTCTAVASGTGTMSLEPAWTASGALLFVRAPAGKPRAEDTVPGINDAGGPYSQASIAAWLDRQAVWTTTPGRGQARLLTGGGAHSPVKAGEGEVFFRHGQLCWLNPATGTTATIAGPIGTAGVDGTSYYGYIDWTGTFAWHR